MKQLTMVLVMVLLASPVFAAGGICEPYLSDHTVLPGLEVDWYTTSYDNGTTATISVWLRLKDHRLDSSQWWFTADQEDPSRWKGAFHASGELMDGEEVIFFEERSNRSLIERNSVRMWKYLSAGKGGTSSDPFQSLHGDLGLEPARITWANFKYREEPAWYDESKTAWNVDLLFDGIFVADTHKEAQALGSQFITPEPATFCLLGLGVAGVLFRRRKT